MSELDTTKQSKDNKAKRRFVSKIKVKVSIDAKLLFAL
jgi:hypothetical protein